MVKYTLEELQAMKPNDLETALCEAMGFENYPSDWREIADACLAEIARRKRKVFFLHNMARIMGTSHWRLITREPQDILIASILTVQEAEAALRDMPEWAGSRRGS